ncbi:CRE-UGT-45 protein [Aphelenchoides avenae]|nr:CRE-UGT-45 protein [Aphelenchus avenae]
MSTALKALVSTINVGYSHVQFDGKLADHLVDAGHEVHFMIAVWDPRVTTNGSEKAHRIIRYAPRDPEGFYKLVSRMAFKQDHFKGVGDAFGREQMQNMVAIMKFYGDDVLSNTAFLEGLRKERYDIGVAEAIDATAHEIFRVLGIRTTFATSATALSSTTTWPLGLPQPPSFIPGVS